MKRTLLCVIILICTACFVACSLSNSDDAESVTNDISHDSSTSQDDTTSLDNPTSKDYFDSDYSNKPTDAEVMTISQGMTVQEIIKVIGKPHNFGTLSGPPSLEWKTQEGKTFTVVFGLTEDTPKDLDSVDQLMGYGVSVYILISD